jgi:hypothetical protein
VDWSGGGTPASQDGGCTFTTNWDTIGVKTVTASIDNTNGCSSSKEKQVTIVKVDKIQIDANGWDDVTGETIVVLQGTKYTFKALPTPSGADWPSGAPVWSGVATGTGETIDVTFANTGTYTLTAKCGCTDEGKSVTIKVIVPQPDEVSFVDDNPGEEHDIYQVTDPVWKRENSPDDPVSYTIGKRVKMEAKFWAADSLSYSTDVLVDAEMGGSATFTTDENVTFGTSWPSEITEHVSDGYLYNYIGEGASSCGWGYMVSWGTNDWIYMTPYTGPHLMCRVYGPPKCSSNEYTENHLCYSVGWGNEGQKVTENDIPKKIQEHCWLNFTMPGHLSDPWDLQTTAGDCQTHAELMAEALKVLGISADGTTASTCRIGEVRWCSTHSAWEYHNFVETGGCETNFEGVCEVNLIDEGTPWDCYYDKAMGEVGGDPAYQKGSHTNMWTEWNNYPPPNYKVIHHFTYWENH